MVAGWTAASSHAPDTNPAKWKMTSAADVDERADVVAVSDVTDDDGIGGETGRTVHRRDHPHPAGGEASNQRPADKPARASDEGRPKCRFRPARIRSAEDR